MCDEPVVQVRDLRALGTCEWQQLNTGAELQRAERPRRS